MCGGLYLDYAVQAFYDGLILLIASVMVVGLGGYAPHWSRLSLGCPSPCLSPCQG